MELRPASEVDFEAEHAVLDVAEGGLRRRHGFPWSPPPFEAFAATHAHLLTTDPDRSWVALEGGRVVAFAAAFVRGDAWFLSDLFVDPDFQGCGIGSALLDRVWGDGPPKRITIADAIQPVSNAMYARRGLVPATPILELNGMPARRTLLLGSAQFGTAAASLAAAGPDSDSLARLDAAAYGFGRVADHAFWAKSARCTLWCRDGEPVAYAYVSPGGRMGPVAGRDGESAAAALAAELARHDGPPVHLDVPGSARELVETALAAGLRITGPPGLLLLSQGLEPPRGLAISGYWLL
jgi:GNAT superfamily N-acetyltransferase